MRSPCWIWEPEGEAYRIGTTAVVKIPEKYAEYDETILDVIDAYKVAADKGFVQYMSDNTRKEPFQHRSGSYWLKKILAFEGLPEFLTGDRVAILIGVLISVG